MSHRRQLREIMEAGGLTQEALARRLGVSFVTVNTWINGHTAPRRSSLEAIEQLHHEIVGASSVPEEQVAAAVRAAETLQVDTRAIVGDRAVVDRLTLHLTYHTNSIEGSTMTLADTRSVLFANRALANRTQVEQAEARNHQAALAWLLGAVAAPRFGFTIDLVRGLHLRLMNGLVEDAGEWRTHGARIAGARVVLANPASVPAKMAALVDELDAGDGRPRSLAEMHARFEQIHPFSDGNGRLGRLLMLAAALRDQRPPPVVIRERRQAYYRYLEAAQGGGDLDPLTLLIAESMLSAHELLAPSPHGDDLLHRHPTD